MKKLIVSILTVSILAVAMAGCGASASVASSVASEAASAADSAVASEAVSTVSSIADAAVDVADAAAIDAIFAAIEAVNEVPNARAIDDFSLENEMQLTKDNIVAYKGDVTNDQADCALVFVAQVKDGTADAVKAELEAYQSTMTSSLYAEFADKVAKAKDARIVAAGNYVAMVISGINGPDYSAIDTVLSNALA